MSEPTSSDLTPTMMSALGEMPVTLLPVDGSVFKCLPPFGPSGATLHALRARGLADLVNDRWVRTPLGESVWGHR